MSMMRHVLRPGSAGRNEREQVTHFIWNGLQLLAEETAARLVVYVYENVCCKQHLPATRK
ncbi:hypothetical protein [Superficieibacter sp.]|uniref:hypothetical protein n=1 Tax=Superficieibacter sp. TaxID=2303322 RepID=UPI0028AF38D4|nr:hypothetical protein [Superficieibacter sp.]